MINWNTIRQAGFAIFCFLPLIYKQTTDHAADSLRATQESFFQYFAMGLIALFIGNIWLSGFLILNLLLFIRNGQDIGHSQVLNIFLGCLLFLVSRNFFKQNKFDTIYKYLLAIVAINLSWMFLQSFRLDPVFSGQTNAGIPMMGPFGDLVGFFGIKMANGIFLTIMLPILASTSLFLGAALLIPIAMTQSSGVALSVAIVVLFYTFFLHKRIFKVLLFLIPIVAGVFIFLDLKTDPMTFTSRFPVWHSAITQTFKNSNSFCAITGYGPDSYRNLTKFKRFSFVGDEHYQHGLLYDLGDGKSAFRYYSPTGDVAKIEALNQKVGETKIAQGQFDLWDSPHSEYVSMFFEYGIIGIFLLMGLLREIYFRFRSSTKGKELVVVTSCLLVYFITSIVHFPLHLARLGYIFPIILGAFYSLTDVDN